MQYNKFRQYFWADQSRKDGCPADFIEIFQGGFHYGQKTEVAFVPNLRGGEGTVEIRHLLSKDELMGHASMYAHVDHPAARQHRFHQHVENTEPYYVIKGKGIFEDNDHRDRDPLGDVCVIEVGPSHAIKNPFDEPLEFMALFDQ